MPQRRRRARLQDIRFAALALALVWGAVAAEVTAEEPLRVAVTVQPIAFLVAEIGGSDVEVTVLVPPGASPHAFEPLPGDVRRLARAQLFLRVGAGFDDWSRRLVNAAPSDIRDVSLAMLAGAGAPGAHVGHGPSGGHHHGTFDPHVWLDPILVRDLLAPGIAAHLAGLDPARRAGFAARLRSFQTRLSQLDREIASRLSPVRGRPYVAFHNAWRRYADRYGLAEIGVVQEFAGEEPTPRELARLVEAARAAGVAALLVEPQLDRRVAETVAAEFSAGTATVDPLGDPRDPARADYAALLRFNTGVFASVLERGAGS